MPRTTSDRREASRCAPRTASRGGAALMALTIAWLTGCGAAVHTPQPRVGELQWREAAGSIESQIATHLERRELIVNRDESDGQEVVILAYEGQRMPDFLVLVRVNRMTPGFGGSDQPHYLVVVHLRTLVTVPPRRLPVVLDGLNAFNAEWAYGTFYVETGSNELVGVWPLRIAHGSPLPLDTVYNAVVSLVQNWNQLYPVLIPAQPEDPATPDGGEQEGVPAPLDAGPVSRATRTLRRPSPPIAPSVPAPSAPR
jgi:hypothetical protein